MRNLYSNCCDLNNLIKRKILITGLMLLNTGWWREFEWILVEVLDSNTAWKWKKINFRNPFKVFRIRTLGFGEDVPNHCRMDEPSTFFPIWFRVSALSLLISHSSTEGKPEEQWARWAQNSCFNVSAQLQQNLR